MRIVAGSAGGIPLSIPKGVELRPTMDLVKGAIFSSLAEMIADARVLDLFAGTGGLGIEALSRGAASAVFVEKEKRAVAVIEKNLEKARLSGVVHHDDVFRYLDKVGPAGGFDLVMADPPYAKRPEERDFTSELIACDGIFRVLAPDGLFVIEHLPGDELQLEGRWECIRQKRYGATAVAFLRRIAS